MANRKLRDVHELRAGGALDTSNPFNPDGLVTLAYEWDDNSRLVGVVDDNANRTQKAYDALNRMVLEVLPDGARTEWAYNVDSTVREITDPNGSVVTRSYDSVNRLVAVSVARGSGVVGTTSESYEYDGLNRVTLSADDNGFLSQIEQAITEYGYDSLSRILLERQNGQSVASTWAPDSKRLSCEYPSGRELTWGYDTVDHPRTVSDASGQIAAWDYEGRGTRVVSSTLRNGTSGSLDYDAVRRVTSLRHTRGGTDFVHRTYGYNGVNYRTSETRFDDNGQRDGYEYDSLYRLVRTELDQAGSGGATRSVGEISYALDGVGNRREVRKDASLEAYSVNARNQYTERAGVTRRHDANGNLLEDERFAYAYDYRNRLVSVAAVGSGGPVARYRYDSQNRRVRKQVFDPATSALIRDVAFVWDAWRVCEEQDASGTALVTYVYGPRFLDEVVELERTAAHPLGTGELFLHQDVRFNVVSVSDASGEVERRYYDDYGNAVDAAKQPVASSAVGNPFGFQGRRLDAETGLLYFRNRMYSPETGRFLQSDPVWDPGNVGNPYTFCWSNPTSLFDPQGTFASSLVTRQLFRASLKVLVGRGGIISRAAMKSVQRMSARLSGHLMNQAFEKLTEHVDLQGMWGDGKLAVAVGMAAEVGHGVSMDLYNFVGESFDNCFLAGTLVETAEGKKKIEEIEVGDRVLSWDQETGKRVFQPVLRLFRNVTEQVVTVRVVPQWRGRGERHSVGESSAEEGEESDRAQEIRCTPGHPWWVIGKGWTYAGHLMPGDKLLGSDGSSLFVESATCVAEQAETFNFEVASTHCYFVGCTGKSPRSSSPTVLVHNLSLRSVLRRGVGALKGSVKRAQARHAWGSRDLGRFWKRLGRRTERFVDDAVGRVGGRRRAHSVRWSNATKRNFDRAYEIGNRKVLMEIKYKLGDVGTESFERMAMQIEGMFEVQGRLRHLRGVEAQVTLFSAQVPSGRTLKELSKRYGDRLRILTGADDLHDFLKGKR